MCCFAVNIGGKKLQPLLWASLKIKYINICPDEHKASQNA
jgi:hypothetical protein